MRFLDWKHQEDRKGCERTSGSHNNCAGCLICIAPDLICEDETADGGRCRTHDQNHQQFDSFKANGRSNYPTCNWAGDILNAAREQGFGPIAGHGNGSELATDPNQCN